MSECVSVRESTLDGLNAEHKFRVWVTILGHIHFTFFSDCVCLKEESPIHLGWLEGE